MIVKPPNIKINDQKFWFIKSSKSSFELSDIVSIEDRSDKSLVGIIQYLDHDVAGIHLFGDSAGEGNTDGTLNGVRHFCCHPQDGIYVHRSKLIKRHLTQACQKRFARELEAYIGPQEVPSLEVLSDSETVESGSEISTEVLDLGKQLSETEENSRSDSENMRIETLFQNILVLRNQLKELEQQKQDTKQLETSLADAQNETLKFKEHNLELQNEVEKQKTAMKKMKIELENTANVYKASYQKVASKSVEMGKQLDHENEKREELRTELEQKKRGAKQLEGSLAASHEETQKCKEQTTKLQSEMEKQKAAMMKIEAETEKKLKSENEKREELRTELEQKKKVTKQLEGSLTESQKETLKYKEQTTELRKEVEKQKESLKKLEAELEIATNDSLDSKASKEKVERKLAETEKTLKNENENFEVLRRYCARLKENKVDAKKLEGSLAESQKETLKYKEQTTELRNEVETQLMTMKKMETELEIATNDGLEYKVSKEKAESKLAKMEAKIKHDNAILESLSTRVQQQNRDITQLEGSVANAEKEALKNKEQCGIIEKSFLELKTVQKETLQKNDELSASFKNQKKDMQMLKVNFTNEQEKCIHYMNCSNEAEKKLADLLKTKTEEEKMFQELQAKLEKRQHKIADLEEKLVDAQTVKEQCIEQLLDLQKENKDRAEETKVLGSQLEASEKIANDLKAELVNVRDEVEKQNKARKLIEGKLLELTELEEVERLNNVVLEKTLADKVAELEEVQKDLENKQATEQESRSKKLITQLESQKRAVMDLTKKLKAAKEEASKYKTFYEAAKTSKMRDASLRLLREG